MSHVINGTIWYYLGMKNKILHPQDDTSIVKPLMYSSMIVVGFFWNVLSLLAGVEGDPDWVEFVPLTIFLNLTFAIGLLLLRREKFSLSILLLWIGWIITISPPILAFMIIFIQNIF